jgi:hypothetical protein
MASHNEHAERCLPLSTVQDCGAVQGEVRSFLVSPDSHQGQKDYPDAGADPVAALFDIDPAQAKRFGADSPNVAKVSYRRRVLQGQAKEYDTHASQRYLPLLELRLAS